MFERAKRDQWPTGVATVVLRAIEQARQVLRISRPGVAVESFALRLIKETAVIFVAAALGRELDVGAALGTRLRGQTSSLDRYFVNCAGAHRDGHEEHCAATLETVRGIVNSVHGHVDRATGQVVIARVASGRRLCPLCQPGQGERVTAAA